MKVSDNQQANEEVKGWKGYNTRQVSDPSYNWFRVLKPKWSSGLKICKFDKECLGIVKVIMPSIVSHGQSTTFDHPLQKSQCMSLRKTIVSNLNKK